MGKYIISLDIGGTTIHSGIVNDQGILLKKSVEKDPARALETKKNILEHFVTIIKKQMEKADSLNGKSNNTEVIGVGIAFPGPFDYVNGVSYIKNLNKFDSLYGINLKTELKERLKDISVLKGKLSKSFQIMFENDANLFALGEYEVGTIKKFARAICITLGTGLGSAFLNNGELIRGKDGVPKSGWICTESFKDRIIDDYVSGRGIIHIASDLGFDNNSFDVKELAECARTGDIKAIQVFDKFGLLLGEALWPYVKSFQPELVILGGQIANSYDLFESGILQNLSHYNVSFEVSADTAESVMIGAASLIRGQEDSR